MMPRPHGNSPKPALQEFSRISRNCSPEVFFDDPETTEKLLTKAQSNMMMDKLELTRDRLSTGIYRMYRIKITYLNILSVPVKKK